LVTYGDIQPFLLLVVGAVITGILLPLVTRKWQDNKSKNGIRIKLTEEMRETVAYGTSKILTSIAKYRDIRRTGESPIFCKEDAAQLYKDF
jgi:hypothetical protein